MRKERMGESLSPEVSSIPYRVNYLELWLFRYYSNVWVSTRNADNWYILRNYTHTRANPHLFVVYLRSEIISAIT
jgi:hypothetical protein